MAVFSSRYTYEGTETSETSITRAGSRPDPTGVAQSREIVTTANSQWLRPFKAEPYVAWNGVTNGNVTATVYGLSGGLLNNDDIWMDVEYLTANSSTLGKIVTTTKTNLLAAGAMVTSDSSTWTTSATTTLDGSAVNVLLSNGNLTATRGATAIGGVASKDFRSAGKFYLEYKITVSSTTANSFGLLQISGSVPSASTSANVVAVNIGASSASTWVNSFQVGLTLGTPALNDVYGIAVDFTNFLFWARRNAGNWNGDAGANPATGVGGLILTAGSYVPQIYFAAGGNTTDVITANFGATAYANAAPSGFANWVTGWTPFKLTATLDLNATAPIASVPATLDGPVTNVTLSNGNLTATHSNTTTNSGACSTIVKTSGKYYFEATFNTTPIAGDCVGVMQVTATYTNLVTNGSNCSIAFGSGLIYSSNGQVGGFDIGTIVAGDKISVAIDLDLARCYFRRNGGFWNNSTTPGNPTAGTGGGTIATPSVGYIPAVGFTTGGSGNNVTMNFGATAFTYAVPSGFTSGWPVPAQPAYSAPVGYIEARVRAAKASTTYYIDPTPVLSVPVVTLITLDPATVFETTLTNGNLTATRTTYNVSIWGGARSIDYRSTGKYYFEVTLGTLPGGGWSLGILKDTGTYQNFVNDATNCSMLYSSSSIFSNNVFFGALSGGAWITGEVICWAVDLGARLAWVRRGSGTWNGSGTANPVTGVGGMTIASGNFAPAIGFGAVSLTTSSTANFGATPFAQTVPSGFTAGWMNTVGTLGTTTSYTTSRYAYEGTETTETSITRVNGAADPLGNRQSRKIVTTANPQWLRPFKAEPYAQWNNTTGSNVSVTVCGTVNSGALPLNDDIWMDVEYLTLSSQANPTQFDGLITSVTLSNGNLTVTHGNALNNCGVASNTFLGTGKYYFEFTATISTNTTNSMGVMLPTELFTGSAGVTGVSVVTGATALIWAGGGSTGINLGTFSNGDVFGFAVDLTARLAWVRRNGGNWNASVGANPATGVGGFSMGAGAFAPYVRLSGTANASDNATGNFGATTYVNAAPSGFGNWLSAPAPLGKIVTTTKSNVLATGTSVTSDSSTWNNISFTTFNDGTVVGTALSNGNLRATHTSVATSCGAYSSDFLTTGKYYFEITIGAIYTSGFSQQLGAVTTNGIPLASNLSANYFIIQTGSGQIYSNNSAFGSALGAFVAGDVLGIALDLTARLGWARKNGGVWNSGGSANPATGVGGATLYPTVGYAPSVTFATNSTSAGSYHTLNCGQSAFAFTAPSGFAGWPASWSPFKLTTTLSSPQPGVAGYIHVRPRAAKASSTYYIDPKITVTPGPFFTWLDSATANGITISNANLRATLSSVVSSQNVAKSISYQTTGKYYFEVTAGTLNGNQNQVGVILSTSTYLDVLFNLFNCSTVANNYAGSIFSNNGNSGYSIGSWGTGDTICCAIDMTNRKSWFRKGSGLWNGDASANPATNVNGATIAASGSFAPHVGFNNGQAVNDYMTANFGGASFLYSAPSGFVGWPL